MQCHVYSFYSCTDSLLSKAVLWQNYRTLKFTGTQFTHSGLILEPDKTLITPDSLVIESTLKFGGVRFTTLKSVMKRTPYFQATEFDCPITIGQYDKMLDIAHETEGLPYDLKGVIGLAAHEDWQEDDRFFCSEHESFVLKGINYGGVDWSSYTTGRVTPKIVRGFNQSVIDLGFGV